MYIGNFYPYYRPYGYGYSYPYPYPYPYPYWGGYGYSSNIYGSAIATQSLVNTGVISGVSQVATPTVIW